jgi:hypothetical protein
MATQRANNGLQRTALRAAAEAKRYAATSIKRMFSAMLLNR